MAEIVTEFKIRSATDEDIPEIMAIEKEYAGPNPTGRIRIPDRLDER